MKPCLLLLPGLMCDREVWQAQIAALEQDYLIQVPDYGLADDLTLMARQVLAAAPAELCAVVGHSMGGRIALEIQRLAPERVTHLGLLDTGAHPLAAGEAGERERAGRMALLNKARTEGMAAMAREWARPMVHPDQLESPVFESVIRMLCRSHPDIFAAQIQALLNRPDARGLLPSIRVPVLLLTGEADGWSPPQQHAAMASVIEHARLRVLEHCGHMSPMEAPVAVTQAIRELLSR